ncbi:cytochrome c oxidase subunit II [Celeribacter neptunius]|uniref:Cytochrome c oxidase subunit 2 n=1 Tax=Celeribacter neptunius TaxID=588602 RepID=A0A1I3TR01_9RHOB|nr:cytochrome c oxidase subunit II [Celeribacter neptunius]SFJ72779.1 cytochrome c oxidase subunit 2 [Celeribacter neptunius]
MRTHTLWAALAASVFATFASAGAQAQDKGELLGAPVSGKMGFQPAATELARDIHGLDHMVLVIITVIVALVCALILWVIVRYNSKTNKTPAKFTHHTPIEVAWTLVPLLVLVVIGSFSLPVLFKQQEIPEGDIYIKVTGYQWFWGYEYVDEGIAFDSYLIGHPATMTDEDYDAGGKNYVLNDAMRAKLVKAGYSEDQFLLATDTKVVVPVGKTIVMGVTGADVIHSWTIPAFGVKQDAVPGRVAELWFKAEKTGTFFGQCSELCGKDHAYMPITVQVVEQDEYDAWLETAKELYASNDTAPSLIKLASAE